MVRGQVPLEPCSVAKVAVLQTGDEHLLCASLGVPVG